MLQTEPKVEDSPYQRAILIALNKLNKPVYQGTVAYATIERRRKANKQARKSRAKNRRG